MDDRTQEQADEQAIVRVFTRDRAYCVDMIERLFVRPDTEESRTMSCRLLEGIYECKREPPHVQVVWSVTRAGCLVCQKASCLVFHPNQLPDTSVCRR